MLACSLARSLALTTGRATETNTAGADFGAGRIDDLDDVLHGPDEVGADLRIRRQIQTLRIGFGIGKRNRIHCYNLMLYFIFTKIPRPRRRYCHATPSPLLLLGIPHLVAFRDRDHVTVATVARYSIPCRISRTSIHTSGLCHHTEHK